MIKVVTVGLLVLWSSTGFAQERLGTRSIAEQVLGQTWHYQDGSKEFFLSSGSSYFLRKGFVAYSRWQVRENRLCFLKFERECAAVFSQPNGRLSIINTDGSSLVTKVEAGDTQSLVRLYGLSLRTAINSGQVRFARKASPEEAARDTPFRVGRAKASSDGTVGRFLVPPEGAPFIADGPFSERASTQQASPPTPIPVPVPQAGDQPAEQISTPVVAPDPPRSPSPSQSDQDGPGVLFSVRVDEDPGCYVHRAQCARRCNRQAPRLSLLRENRFACLKRCETVYICGE